MLSVRSGHSHLRCFAHQKARLAFRQVHWRGQLLSAGWSWAVDFAAMIIVRHGCKAQKVGPHIYVVLCARMLGLRFIRDVGGTGFWARSGLWRLCLLRSTISNDVPERIKRIDEPLV